MRRPNLSMIRPAMRGIALAGALAACGETPPPTATVDAQRDLVLVPAVGASITVCKMTGVAAQEYSFTATGVGGTGWYIPPMPRTLTASMTPIQDVTCKGFWLAENPASAPTDVTITENGAMPDSIVVNPFGPNKTVYTGTNAVTVTVDYFTGKLIKVYNPETPPPPPGAYGCTPGYWKQQQHFGNWTGYAPGNIYNTVFGAVAFSPTMTLLQALEQGGGGIKRLGRHSTAALLNAASLGSDFGMTTGQVIAAVQAAITSGDYDLASDQFQYLNERGCPLGRAD